MIPEPMVVAGRELPLRPRCFRCAGIRLDYTSTNPETGEVRQHVTIIGAEPGCEHRWTDD